MLQNIRKGSQGPVAKVIVYGIVFTMALFGFESIVGGFGDGDSVATVNGEGIPKQQFEQRIQNHKNRLLAQLGENGDPSLIDDEAIRKQVLDSMIQRETVLQDANNKSLFMTDSAIDQYIYQMEAFQENGAFSNERMQYLLRTSGLNLAGFREQLRQDFVVAQPQSALVGSSFVSDTEQSEMITLDREERSFSTLTFSKKDFLEGVEVSEDEIKKFYETNAADYMTEESVDVTYIVIDRANFVEAVEVTQEELTRLYESETADYEGSEERDASHILISFSDDRTDEESLAKANEVLARIQAGESFEALAKEFSDDPGSAANGGALGAAGKGVYVDAFEEALFSLAKAGDLSSAIKTQFGYHLIRLNEVIIDEAPSFEELKDSLEARIRNEKALDQYAQLSEEIADITYSTPDLAGPAEELSLEIRSLENVTASSDHELFSKPRIQALLFSEEFRAEDANSEFIEVSEGRGLVFNISAHHDAKQKSLEDVRADIELAIRDEKASEAAKVAGEQVLAQIKDGSATQLEWVEKENAKRNDFSVDRSINKKAYSIADIGSLDTLERSNGDFVIIRLDNISQDSAPLQPSEQRQIAQVMSQRFGATDFQAYTDSLENSALIIHSESN